MNDDRWLTETEDDLWIVAVLGWETDTLMAEAFRTIRPNHATDAETLDALRAVFRELDRRHWIKVGRAPVERWADEYPDETLFLEDFLTKDEWLRDNTGPDGSCLKFETTEAGDKAVDAYLSLPRDQKRSYMPDEDNGK